MTAQLSSSTSAPVDRRWRRGILGGVAGFLVASAVSFGLLELVGPSTVYNDEIQSEKLTAVWDGDL